MAENALNNRVMALLKGHHPVRVENAACPGTPDINYTGGWIENKMLSRWPTRGEVVKVDHFSPQQRVWHILRAQSGGTSYVCIQIERDLLLIDGEDAARVLGRCDEATLRAAALGVWRVGDVNKREFLGHLGLEAK